jgi:hypothetical protein
MALFYLLKLNLLPEIHLYLDWLPEWYLTTLHGEKMELVVIVTKSPRQEGWIVLMTKFPEI